MKNQTKKKIRVGYVVKAKVGELEEITMDERSRRMRKDLVGGVQSVMWNKSFLVKFEDGKKK